MKILMMAAADYATFEPVTGKLNILGFFRRITANEFPASHPRMCFVIKFEGEFSDHPEPHSLNLTMVDEDGGEILNIEGPFEMPIGTVDMPPECNVILELNGLTFHHPGEYLFHVRVDDGLVEDSISIAVIQQEI